MIQRVVRGGVVEVLERILHKGIVIDTCARVRLAAIDLVTNETDLVIASLAPNDVVPSPRSAPDGSHCPSAGERISLRIVHKAFDAWNFHDVEGYAALLDNGYIGEIHPRSTLLHGPEDVFHAFPDCHFTIEGTLAAGNDVLVSWLAVHTRQAADDGADLVGPPLQVPGCTVVRLRGRRIVHTWSYWDIAGRLQISTP